MRGSLLAVVLVAASGMGAAAGTGAEVKRHVTQGRAGTVIG